jgi:hypothetical protein
VPNEPADDPVHEPSFPYAAALRRARGGAPEEMIADALRIE